jgi:hypothetical protein
MPTVRTGIGAARIAVAVSLATADCSSPVAPTPSIQVNRATCETGLTTLATFDATPTGEAAALAAGADGTVFVNRWDANDPSVRGIYAIPPSGSLARISDSAGAWQAWVEGDTLWMGWDDGSLQTLPTTGGTPTVVGRVPAAISPDLGIALQPDARAFALDATHLYVGVDRGVGAVFEIWSIERTGGAAQSLFATSDPTFINSHLSPLAAVGDALYFPKYQGGDLMRVPKAGGTATVVRSDVFGPVSFLVPLGTNWYATGFDGSPPQNLARFPMDPAMPPTPVAGVGYTDVELGVGDDAGVYVLFSMGQQPAQAPWAIARFPTGNESSTALGCTATFDAGAGLEAWGMALNATHVYALINDLGPPGQFMVVRAAR